MELSPINQDQLQIKTTNDTSDLFYQLQGSEMVWHEVQSVNGATFYDDVNSHDWTNLGIYSKSDVEKYNITYANGGLSDTILNGIYDAYYTSGLLVCNISNSAFRASISPNMKITIPLSGGTGGLSGLTTTDLYTAFISQNDSLESDGSGVCSTYEVDALESESYGPATYEIGLGYTNDGINNPGPNTNGRYESGKMFLFSNDIYLSGNTGTTFDTGWSAINKHTHGDGELATFTGPTRNLAVGIVSLDTGILTIWNEDIVDAFDTSVATGGTITSGLTFNTSDCSAYIRDRDTSSSVEINTILEPGQYVNSSNSSVLDAKERGISCDNIVSITRICFYDEYGILTATGGLSESLVKRDRDFISINCSLTLDNGIQDSVMSDGRATITPAN
jgi:hypothetical protein